MLSKSRIFIEKIEGLCHRWKRFCKRKGTWNESEGRVLIPGQCYSLNREKIHINRGLAFKEAFLVLSL